MDDESKLIAIAICIIFGSLFCGLGFSEYLKHTEKMECISKRGEFMKDTCIFREAKY